MNVIQKLEAGLGPLKQGSPPNKRAAHAAIDDVRTAIKALEKIAKGKNGPLDASERVAIYEQIALQALLRLKDDDS